MRLTLSALLCAALLASPALAHDPHDERMMPPPPPGADMPPPAGYGVPYGTPIDQRWQHDQERMRGEWMERCGRHGHDDRDGERDGPNSADGCGPRGYAAPYGYPGAYIGYAVPMIMVPVLRSKPCPQVAEEWVEEVVPVRRRLIPRRPHVIHDKRVPMKDKRVRITPSKRIAY